MKKYYEYYGGNKVSEYGLQYGRVDYATLSKCFEAVLCNNIPEVDPMIWDNVESGELYQYFDSNDNEISYEEYLELEEAGEECYEITCEIFQYYIVSDNALYYLKEAEELVLYSEALDCYIWCVDHYGTGWSYVLTSIELKEVK